MFQILVTKPATQAVFLVTIFLLKLKQSLRIGSGGHRQTDTIPKSGYVIVFGLQGFKETGGTVTQDVYKRQVQKKDKIMIEADFCPHFIKDEVLRKPCFPLVPPE